MQIRECRIADYRSIYDLNQSAFGHDFPLEKTKRRLAEILKRDTDKIYVACLDGQVVGYIHGGDYECTFSEPLKNILSLAVDTGFRGKGIGKALLNAVEDWARECGCCGVRLVSGFDRTNAHEFYLHCGYTRRKKQENFIKIFP